MRQHWTPEQLDGLRRLYPDFEASVVAKVLGRKVGGVLQMANKLGIAKSEAFLKAYRERQAHRARVDPRVQAGMFKPGLVPWNKGKHTVAGGRSAHTRFKPGLVPVNTMPIGIMSTQTTPHITQLRSTLMDTLKRLRELGSDGKPLDLEQLKGEVQLANAMKGVADTLVDTARVEVDYIKATVADRSDFLEPHPAAQGLPAPSTTPSAHNPFPTDTVHRLQG